MTSIIELEKRVLELQERNKKVEGDKAWETSWARKILIFAFTYLAISVYFYVVGLPQPFLNAVVPALAFVISTLTMPFFKKQWLKRFYKNN